MFLFIFYLILATLAYMQRQSCHIVEAYPLFKNISKHVELQFYSMNKVFCCNFVRLLFLNCLIISYYTCKKKLNVYCSSVNYCYTFLSKIILVIFILSHAKISVSNLIQLTFIRQFYILQQLLNSTELPHTQFYSSQFKI